MRHAEAERTVNHYIAWMHCGESTVYFCCCRKQIEKLSDQIERHDSDRTLEENYVAQMRLAKAHAEERENQLKTDYAEKLAVKSKELLALKEVAAKQLADIESLKKSWQNSKDMEMSTLEERHRLELESLVRVHEEEVIYATISMWFIEVLYLYLLCCSTVPQVIYTTQLKIK